MYVSLLSSLDSQSPFILYNIDRWLIDSAIQCLVIVSNTQLWRNDTNQKFSHWEIKYKK